MGEGGGRRGAAKAGDVKPDWARKVLGLSAGLALVTSATTVVAGVVVLILLLAR